MIARIALWWTAVVLTQLWTSIVSETNVRMNMEKSFDAIESRRKVAGTRAAYSQITELAEQMTGQLYFITTQVDLKALKTVPSLLEIYPTFVLPECKDCGAVIQNDSLIDKFGQVFRIKCPAINNIEPESDDCIRFDEDSRAGKYE